MLDAKIASALNKIIQNSHFKKKVSLEEQKALKEDRFLRGRQIAFMIYDNFRVTGAHLDYTDLFSITLRNDNVQEFDTRWNEILFSKTKIPSDDILESLYKLRIGESDQLKKKIGIVRHGKSSEDIDAQSSKVEDGGEEKHRSETSIAKFRRQGAMVKGRRDLVALEDDKEFAGNGKQQDSAREKIVVVSDTTGKSVQNRHQKPLHPLSHQHTEVEVRREKRTSDAGVHLGRPIDSRAKTS